MVGEGCSGRGVATSERGVWAGKQVRCRAADSVQLAGARPPMECWRPGFVRQDRLDLCFGGQRVDRRDTSSRTVPAILVSNV